VRFLVGPNYRTWIIGLAIVGWVASTAAPVKAEQADDLIRSGLELRRQGRDQEALQIFRQAQALSPTPRAQAQVGLAEQALGLWVPAENDMLLALQNNHDPWIEKNAKTLEEALHFIQAHLGSVEVWGKPPGAEVLLDGRVVGVLPMEHAVRIANSEVLLQVRAKGFTTISRTLQVPRGQYSVREQVDLYPVAIHEITASNAIRSSSEGTAPVETNADLSARAESAPDSHRPFYRRPAFWVVVALGIGAAVGAGILFSDSGKEYPSPTSTGTFNHP
jgi:hypothetical protein